MGSNYKLGIFVKDQNIRGMYFLQKPQQFYFPFLRINPSKDDTLKNNGAEYVIQSFLKISLSDQEKTKILHSGLIEVAGYAGCYFGDNVNLKKREKDFFILYLNNGILKMYYFNGRNPRNKRKFAKAFLDSIANL